jgi:hypothetical protein
MNRNPMSRNLESKENIKIEESNKTILISETRRDRNKFLRLMKPFLRRTRKRERNPLSLGSLALSRSYLHLKMKKTKIKMLI